MINIIVIQENITKQLLKLVRRKKGRDHDNKNYTIGSRRTLENLI